MISSILATDSEKVQKKGRSVSMGPVYFCQLDPFCTMRLQFMIEDEEIKTVGQTVGKGAQSTVGLHWQVEGCCINKLCPCQCRHYGMQWRPAAGARMTLSGFVGRGGEIETHRITCNAQLRWTDDTSRSFPIVVAKPCKPFEPRGELGLQ